MPRDKSREKSREKSKEKRDKPSSSSSMNVKDMQGMVTKWASIPFAIVVVLCAGSAINLSGYFLELKDKLGFEPIHQEFIKWGVLFGYYGGFLAGPMVDAFNTTPSFVLSAFISCGGYIGLGFYTASDKVTTVNTIVIVCLIILVSFTSAVATIAAIATVIKNFSRNVGSMVASIMITYYLTAPWFDFTIRHGYFEDVEVKVNMIAMGVITFVVYILAAFIVDENEQSPELKRASSLSDRFGILIYAAIAGGFVAAIYFTCIVAEKYKVGVFFITLFILINFVALAFTISTLLGTIKNGDTRNVGEERVPPRKNFIQMFGDIRYYCLLFGTLIVVGTGSAFYYQAGDLAIAMGKDKELGAKVLKAFWLSKCATALGGGLIAAIFVRIINGWLFAAIAAFTGMVGFAFVFLGDRADIWFYIAGFLIGGAVGGWWVIVPQIILDDAGPKSYETLWGFALTMNVLGMFAFDRLFVLINGKEEPGSPSTCKGTSCYMAPYIIFAGLCMIAGILALVGLSNDEGTGGKGGERRSLRDNDANKRGRSSSKDTRGTKRDKSSGKDSSKKRSGSRPKSKPKTRT
jgi:hypothetical protein